MKAFISICASFSAAFLCSCAVDVTQNLQQALAHVEEEIEYHDIDYMSDRKMYVPHGVDEKNLGTLKFNFAFEQGNTSDRKNDSNILSKNEWNAFRREFENAIAGTKRFPLALILAYQKLFWRRFLSSFLSIVLFLFCFYTS